MNEFMDMLESMQTQSPRTVTAIFVLIMIALFIIVVRSAIEYEVKYEKEQRDIKRSQMLLDDIKSQCEYKVKS